MIDFELGNGETVRVRESVTEGKWYWWCARCKGGPRKSGDAESMCDSALRHCRRERAKVAA